MKIVQPIKDMKVLNKFNKEVRKRSERDFIMAKIGFNTGLRIGDILSLKVKDVYNKSYITINEQKTNKLKRISIKNLQPIINNYIDNANLDENDFLIKSRERDKNGRSKAIHRSHAYRRLKSVALDLGIEDFGTHSLRKSFGYHFYKKTKDIAKLMIIFNHSSEAITLDYIGMTQESIDNSLEDFIL